MKFNGLLISNYHNSFIYSVFTLLVELIQPIMGKSAQLLLSITFSQIYKNHQYKNRIFSLALTAAASLWRQALSRHKIERMAGTINPENTQSSAPKNP
ncbi:hypothetical protein SLW70_03580 [Flavobacterium sp. NG2]|uniref:hypothetical protein n=1 Tax=Flavobacterium sp. NG2 TaxID=3097547 RepID=UPI002A8289EC|nr:hypothetical protein [Flavobacterium sp. NG2]WPR72234.1 hypothetical protein SLW70_03580 [Flavobacterium sp. NG2]